MTMIAPGAETALTLDHVIELGYELAEGEVDQQGNYTSKYDCLVYDKITWWPYPSPPYAAYPSS